MRPAVPFGVAGADDEDVNARQRPRTELPAVTTTPMALPARLPMAHATSERNSRRRERLTVDQALIALLIGAMDANQHVSAEEAAHAHNIIWSMKRFRRKSGESVGRLIGAMRTLIEAQGAAPVIAAAARSIPLRLRLPAFAVCADLILADGRLESAERRFLKRLGRVLVVDGKTLDAILAVMLIKNSA